ncbi:MAG: ABC transporter ATP-binding protein [Oscillospiraceae bacterium]|nr:ABC transporter ATP-binding protein [Oscillospiraceae bacterium]
MEEIAVRFDHVSMEFPGVLANDDISLSIRKGEVFALVGENGAGKSTLMHLLYGMHTPTNGEIWVKGERLTEYSPKAAIQRGIGMVHQHFMLVPSFSVAQNVVMSKEPRKFKLFYDWKAAEEKTRALSQEYGLSVDPSAIVGELSVGLQQRVEILKALYRGAELLILDEPTAVLTPQETTELFSVIRRVVREKGMTVILITHKLYEVKAISDRVGIMRKGRLIAVKDTASVTERELASLMVGRPVLYEELERSGQPGEIRLAAKDLTVYDNRGLTAVKKLSLSLRAGEILGIAAIEGNGQSELLEALTGLRSCASGSIGICGQQAANCTPGEIRAMGLAHIPEDRLATGVSKDASVAENLLVGRHKAPEFRGALGYQKQSSIARYAEGLFEKFDIRGAGIAVSAGSLSGGNLQKVVVARECSFDTPVLIISQPTRGVDVGAIEFIHKQIMDKRNEGTAILLCSADLDEVFRLSDRIITLYEGEITGEFTPNTIEKEELGYYMTGNRRKEAGAHEAITH